MPAVYNPTVARATIFGTLDGQRITNTIHVDSPAEWTFSRLTDLGGLLASWLNVDYMPLLSSAYALDGVQLDSLASINAPGAFEVFNPLIVGGNTAPALPNNVALCVAGKTGFRGRSARGRWFVAGLTEQQVTGSRVSSATRAALVEQFAELRNQLIAQNMRPVVYSTTTLGNPRPIGVVFPIQEWAIIDDVVDSQRRRLPGRGI